MAADVTRLRALSQSGDAEQLRKAGRTLARSTPDGLRPVRVGLLSTATAGAYPYLLRAELAASGMGATLESAPYGTFELSLATGDLGIDSPDVVTLLLDESVLLPRDWDATEAPDAEQRAQHLCRLVESAAAKTDALLVLHTVPMPAVVRDAVISWRARTELAAAWHRANAALLELGAHHRNVITVDLAGLLADQSAAARDDRLHHYADVPYTDAALYCLAREVRRVCQARFGLSRKVLALDLDNTLWGGVLGEVGPGGVELGGLYPGKSYRLLQAAVRQLHRQGVILVLASKNDADAVAEAIAEHPEMLLRPDAFAVSAVNWQAKPGNLAKAADSLGLDVGSFVFLDDSDFERGAVADALPQVAVVSAAGDPAHLARTLLHGGWFDVLELTDTDRQRPGLYRTRAQRTEFGDGFGSTDDYLAALDIRCLVEPATAYTVPRIAQLAARTNQFNLTGERFDQAATARLADSPDALVAALSVADRFGDEGIVGAAWVRADAAEWEVLNLVLSCRVLGRGVELAFAAWLAERARAAGAESLVGRYVPSARNSVAADFWTRAGMRPDGPDGRFHLDLTEPAVGPAWIRITEGSDV